MSIFHISFSISLKIKRKKGQLGFYQIFRTKNEVRYLKNYYFRLNKHFFHKKGCLLQKL